MSQSLTTAEIGPLEVFRGDTLVFTAPVRRADAAVDLTDLVSATFRVATDYGETPLFSLTVGSGITNAAPTTGVLTCTASTTQTALLTGSVYVADLEIAEDGGRTTTVWRGLVKVLDPVG